MLGQRPEFKFPNSHDTDLRSVVTPDPLYENNSGISTEALKRCAHSARFTPLPGARRGPGPLDISRQVEPR